MNTRRSVIILFFAGLLAEGRASAVGRSTRWNRQVRLAVSSRSKQQVVALMTEIAGKSGLRPTNADGLNELKGRQVVFLSFGRSKREMLATVTDVITLAELQIRAYYEVSLPGVVENMMTELVQRAAGIQGVQVLEDRSQQ